MANTVMIALLVICAVAPAALAVDRLAFKGPVLECAKQNDTAICDDIDGCAWCVGSSVGTGCYPEGIAKKLPTKWFTCDKTDSPSSSSVLTLAGPMTVCIKRAEDDCKDECVWCQSLNKMGGCFTPKEAKILPKAMFKCDKNREE